MADPLPSQRRRFPLALVASLAIHAALVAPFLVQLPEPQAEAPVEQSVDVEIVPEPEKPPEPVEAPKPEEPKSAAPPPAPAPGAEMKPDAAADKTSPMAAPQPFEASAPEKPETPPDPVTLPAPAGEATTSDRPTDPPDDAPPADRPTPDAAPEAAGVAEPKPVPESAPSDTSPAPPEILDAGKASDDGLASGPSADAVETPPADLPAPGADMPMTPAEQAAFIPPKPAVPETKPLPEEAPKPAKALYARDMLADPRVRGALGKLPPNKRIVQMCVIEAGEQVRHSGAGLTPDLLKAFGRNGGLITGTHLSASGGAVRSRGDWHDIRFECTVNAAFDAITGFRFALGGRVPKADWAARGLMAE